MKASHTHLISCCLSEIKRRSANDYREGVFRVLDAGCGNGALVADLLNGLMEFEVSKRVEIYGFEVIEHGATHEWYRSEVAGRLSTQFPGVDWESRICVVSGSDSWPFSDEMFDLVVSNQVIEHVLDLGWFFEQKRRVLRQDGFSVHHFPTAELLIEPHSGVPFAHWPKSNEARAFVIRLFSRVGLGKFGHYRRERGHTLEMFCKEFVTYLRHYTYFRSMSEVLRVAHRAGLTVDARYNWALFKRWLSGETLVYPYAFQASDAVFTRALSRFASGTIVCQKR